MRIRAVPVAIGLVVIWGAGCSADDPSLVGSGAPSEDSVAAASHNDADVSFAQSMVPHHAEAIEIARLAIDRAADQRVRGLAGRIKAAQVPEIERMREWLRAWGTTTDGTDHGEAEPRSRMMSEEGVASLRAVSGAKFDRMFVERMIAHHQGAAAMADQEVADGESPEALAFARAMKSAREREVAEMKSLLEEL